jgi:hypothetical protein
VTITGGVDDNKVASPIPAKAEAEEDEKKEEKKEMSATEKAFKSLMDSMNSKNPEEAQRAFAELGTEVEKAFAPEPKPVDANDLAAIVKSAVEAAMAPMAIKLATLEAAQKSNTVSTDSVVKSKALSLNPGGLDINSIVQRSGQPVAPQAPVRKLSQIEMLARKSTGASV